MNDSLVHIATFSSEPEAEQARIALQQAGIMARLGGGAAATALSYVGPALGGVRLYTLGKDAPKALTLLQTPASEPSQSDQGWYCGGCYEDVDPGFDVCWSCGRNRDAAAVTRPAGKVEIYQRDDDSGVHNTPSDASITLLDEHTNPYAAPRQSDILQQPKPSVQLSDDEEPMELPGEAIVLRAWRAAVLGLVFLPGILHFYSMVLLLRAATVSDDFSPRINTRFYQTWALNLLGIGAYIAIFVYLF